MTNGTCSIDGCDSTARARTWCKGHYRRWLIYGDPVGAPPPRTLPTCTECGLIVRHVIRQRCTNCYRRWRYWQDPDLARDRHNRKASNPTNPEAAAERRLVRKEIRAIAEMLGREPLRSEKPEAEQERLRSRDRAAYDRAIERRRQLTRERMRANAAGNRARVRQWRLNNPEKAQAASAIKKARKRGIEATLTPGEWLAILNQYERRCYYCGLGGVPMQQEHMIPLSRSGAHSAENVVPACGPCNNSKGTLTPDEFIARRAKAI